MRSPLLALFLSLALTTPGLAQKSPDRATAVEPGPQALDAQIEATTRRWADFQERFRSTDPIARSTALAAALRDESPAIRSGALGYALRGRETLPVTIDLPTGSPIDAATVPNPQVAHIRWERDDRSFSGATRSQNYGGVVHGELVEGKLLLNYTRLGFNPDFGGEAARRQNRLVHNCFATLSFARSPDALTGTLQCEGLSQTLPLRLPLT